MVDIHTHILPNLDDGAKSIDESVAIVKKAYENGVTDLVVTPHFIFGSSYNANNKTKEKKYDMLLRRIEKLKLDINIYLGNEIFIDRDIVKFIKDGSAITINNSRYLFFELPMNNDYKHVEDIIFNIKTSGYIPVIAHPERYLIFKDNISLVERFLELGVLFQSNIGSFLGVYGDRVKDTAILLLKHNCIHFIASDTHREDNIFYDNISELKILLSKYIDGDKINDLLVKNPLRVINDENIIVSEYIPFKKNIFGKWK